MTTNRQQKTLKKNLLHSITLKTIITEFVMHYGWARFAKAVPIGCFSHNPSIQSSLNFMRKTPREQGFIKVPYLKIIREI